MSGGFVDGVVDREAYGAGKYQGLVLVLDVRFLVSSVGEVDGSRCGGDLRCRRCLERKRLKRA